MSQAEFPLLELHGLYAADIRGDGNCLFNALSDQMYGTQDQHREIRSRTIAYMRDHADYFKQYIEVYAGGGIRRNPKRKNAGGYASNNTLRASPEELDRVFQEHIQRMSKGGAWGDNMEIVAFSRTFEANVKIYQQDFAYEIRTPVDADMKPTLHIAYHTWEHYSSIRNIDGPHTGVPYVSPKQLTPDDERRKDEVLNQPKGVAPWQVKSVEDAVSGMVNPPDQSTIIRVLEECRGSIDSAFEKLFSPDEQLSISSQQSSSVEREVDSDHDYRPGPKKKQDRRMSRATLKMRDERRKQQIASKLDTFGDSLETLVNATSSPPVGRRRSHIVIDSDDEDMSPAPLKDGDTSSSSDYSEESQQQQPTGIKINLSLANNSTGKTTGKSLQKNFGPQKRLVAARDRKSEAKRLQKLASKERKQAASASSSTKSSALEAPGMTRSDSNSGMTSAIRTLYI